MGGTYSWTRGGTADVLRGVGYFDGSREFVNSGEVVIPKDSVTSYRTHDEIGLVSLETQDQESLLSSQSQLDARRAIKRDYLRNKAKNEGNTGHPFSATRYTLTVPQVDVTFSFGGHTMHYAGAIYPSLDWASLFPAIPVIQTGKYGTMAIKSTLPTNPYAETGGALIELVREKMPDRIGAQALQARTRAPLKAGSEYLNVEFGWKPLIRDTQDLLKAVTRGGSILKKFNDNSGRLVKRKWALDPITSTSTSTGTGSLRGNITSAHSEWSRMFRTTTSSPLLSCPYTENTITTESYWFSGSYVYAVPQGGSILDKLARYESDAHKLLGLRLTPELVWNAAPWSWLIDWKLNVGDVIGNFSALHSDGLVLKYGFLMRHTVATRTRVYRTNLISGMRPGLDMNYTIQWTTTRKERVGASPYGFDVDPASFSTKQWSILGALGLTKAEKRLSP